LKLASGFHGEGRKGVIGRAEGHTFEERKKTGVGKIRI